MAMQRSGQLTRFDGRALRDHPNTIDAQPTLRASVRQPARIGYALIVVFLGGFLAWAAIAPIAAGAVAPGVISPDGSRRTVQHLEGGIIAELKVRDGDFVEAGQPVVELQSIQAESTYKAYLDQYRTLLASQARLEAEQIGGEAIAFPPELTSDPSAKMRSILESQRKVFASARHAHLSQKNILGDRIRQFEEQISALQSQVDSAAAQIAILREELDGKELLLRKGVVTKPEVLKLRRAVVEQEGFRGEYLGEIAEARQKIGELQTQLVSLDAERTSKTAAEADQVRSELAVAVERLNSSKDILERTVVLAPISGKVVNARFSSPGAVVRGGEAIMDIVPTEEKLLIDARVSPTDIDVVKPGLEATVRLSAFSSREMPRITGIVRTVSADRIVDGETGQSYYLTKIEVDRELLAQLGKRFELVPGMPAEVLIVTEERTMAQYLLEPFREAFERSFHEI